KECDQQIVLAAEARIEGFEGQPGARRELRDREGGGPRFVRQRSGRRHEPLRTVELLRERHSPQAYPPVLLPTLRTISDRHPSVFLRLLARRRRLGGLGTEDAHGEVLGAAAVRLGEGGARAV